MRRPLLTCAAAAALCACSVGPDFKKPAAPEVTGYLSEPLQPQTGVDAHD